MAELVREIMIDATPETIWPYLTEADKHVEWEGTKAELDPRPGGVYRVLVAGQFQAAGEFVEVVPKEKVVFTFGWEQEGNPITPGSTTVEITLHPEGSQDPPAPRAPRPARRRRGRATTPRDGRTTSTASRCGRPAATRGRTAGPEGASDGPREGPRPRPGGHRGDRRRTCDPSSSPCRRRAPSSTCACCSAT